MLLQVMNFGVALSFHFGQTPFFSLFAGQNVTSNQCKFTFFFGLATMRTGNGRWWSREKTPIIFVVNWENFLFMSQSYFWIVFKWFCVKYVITKNLPELWLLAIRERLHLLAAAFLGSLWQEMREWKVFPVIKPSISFCEANDVSYCENCIIKKKLLTRNCT